jgi:hypothetical protein
MQRLSIINSGVQISLSDLRRFWNQSGSGSNPSPEPRIVIVIKFSVETIIISKNLLKLRPSSKNSNQPIRELYKFLHYLLLLGKFWVCLDPGPVPLTQLNPDPINTASKDDTDRVNANKLD